MAWDIVKELGNTRKRIDDLNLPASVYAGVQIEYSHVHVTEIGIESEEEHCFKIDEDDENLEKITSWFRKNAESDGVVYIAASIIGENNIEHLSKDLWLKEDIVPIIASKKPKGGVKCTRCGLREFSTELARYAQTYFDKNNIPLVQMGGVNEVFPSKIVDLDEYTKFLAEEEVKKLMFLTEQFKGKKIRFFSATPRGGGVAIMRHALIRLFRLLEVEAHWHVMQEITEVFEITKTKFHNVLQGVADSDIRLSERDKKVYTAWIKDNAALFEKEFKDSDVIVIDDPQPAGLISHIKKTNPKTKIIYRSHIHLDTELLNKKDSPQAETWEFLWKFIRDADCFVSHPIKEFVPEEVPAEKVVFMPATTDLFDGLNKRLSEKQKNYYMHLFNKLILESGQTPLDLNRPFVTQIARFDPSKGIQDVVNAYTRVCRRMKTTGKKLPQLVLIGHASIDDPDGTLMYNLTLKMLQKREYREFADDIKIMRLQPIDQLLNAILRESKVFLQLSHKEGFETKVTEALMKGKPVISYKSGGIPLQIEHGITGFIVDEVGDDATVAGHIYDLLTDDYLYSKMSKNAAENWRKDLTTVSNAFSWLDLSNKLLAK